MSIDSSKKNDVIFFFGAGASVDAGIPDTYSFVKDFEEYIGKEHSRLSKNLLTILEKREDFNNRSGFKRQEVDVEQLLDILRRLLDRRNEPLLEFYEGKQFSSDIDQESCSELKSLLEDFIREKVIVEDENKLKYLEELLQFDTPLEIYSTNYDTCVEQVSYTKHRSYTDGFDIYWKEKNFDENYDIKHYKMHGSVIWYENTTTKQCVKIPAHAFIEGKPVELRLIYGEPVKPLLIYPAQKSEYIEPLTDLQLLFKKRLIDPNTRFVVFVGYSFRDDYVVRMVWDAARVNDKLDVVLISPNAYEIFDEKLKYTNKEKKDLSRIHDRFICLPYPFSSVIYRLKNYYIDTYRKICDEERKGLEAAREGQNANWESILIMCLESEFLSKAEFILEEKIQKSWNDLLLNNLKYKLHLSLKSWLHSVIARDCYEDIWLGRTNDLVRIIKADSLQVYAENEVSVSFGNEIDEIIQLLLDEYVERLGMLTPKFAYLLNNLGRSFGKLKKLQEYSEAMKFARLGWEAYAALRSGTKEIAAIVELSKSAQESYDNQVRLSKIVATIEKKEVEKILDGKVFQFELGNKDAVAE